MDWLDQHDASFDPAILDVFPHFSQVCRSLTINPHGRINAALLVVSRNYDSQPTGLPRIMANRPTVVRTVPALRRALASFRKGGEHIALVPTMGALHAGHLA
ncbi:MAG TPA: pantoate--beta-alanine ligase, partial [Pseudolabrys sp.]